MLDKIRQLFEKLSMDTQAALQYCYECEKLCYYADFDTCNCGQKYNPSETGEVCPACGEGGDSDYISHCSVCDAEIYASYLSQIIYAPHELTNEQLESIKTQLEKILVAKNA